MDPDELYLKVKHQPFEPFRIHVSDGIAYKIDHPDQIMVGRRSCYVGIAGRSDGPFQRIATVANIHITRLEPLMRGKARRRTRRNGRNG